MVAGLNNGYELNELVFQWAIESVDHDLHLEIAKWLRDKGCHWNANVYNSARTSQIKEWLKDNGCPTE